MKEKKLTVSVIGLGLIGGSLGLALKSNVRDICVNGFDINKEVMKNAKKIGAIDILNKNLKDCVKNSEIIFLAAPVKQCIKIIKILPKFIKKSSLITDVCSTKLQIEKSASKHYISGINFIGGHPMTGKEKSGIEFAQGNLFKNCIWCLTAKPVGKMAKKLVNLIITIGGTVKIINPEEHDKFVSGISHLPLFVSIALMNTVSLDTDWKKMRMLAAGGFRDTTRIASGDENLALNIFSTNKENVIFFAKKFRDQLSKMIESLEKNEEGRIKKMIINAKNKRENWINSVK